METAMYFLGGCLLVFSAAAIWAAIIVRRTVSDLKSSIAMVPTAVDLASRVVTDANAIVTRVGTIVDDARASFPDLSDREVTDTLWKGVGEGGAQVIKSFSAGLFGGDASKGDTSSPQ